MKVEYKHNPPKPKKTLGQMTGGSVVRFPDDCNPLAPWVVSHRSGRITEVIRLSDGKLVSNPMPECEVEELECTLVIEGVK